jgi:hypothetical protein
MPASNSAPGSASAMRMSSSRCRKSGSTSIRWPISATSPQISAPATAGRLTIATKYWRLTQQFFSGNHGIQLYRIVESLGATEGAPASGSADIIVDITSTGSTLTANHLKILSDGVILKSEACLVRARKAEHEGDAVVAEIITRLRAHSEGSHAARRGRRCWPSSSTGKFLRHPDIGRRAVLSMNSHRKESSMADLSSFPITKTWPAKNPDIIQLYSLPTPNGVKVSIALEELGLRL